MTFPLLWVLAAAYLVTAIVNLASAWTFREGARKVSKCLLMPVLLAVYLVGARPFLITALLALVFCWIGDVLLIRKEEPKFFRLGLGAFLLGHVFYIIAFFTLAGGVNVGALLGSILVAIPLCIALLRYINASQEMRIPVAVYAVVIFAMSIAALQLFLNRPSGATLTLFIGSLVFMFSDAMMAYLLFHNRPKQFNFITMVPYIVAQALIMFGLVTMGRI